MADARKSLADSQWAGPVALGLLHLILALLCYHNAPFVGGDDATYVSLARSLIERHDYTDVWDPALPMHTQYPPIFPVVVAAGLLAGLDPQSGMKILMIFISTGAVLASCIWLRRASSAGIAFCAGFFIAIAPEIMWMGQEVLSDHLFWFFSMLALIAWHRTLKSDAKPIPVMEVVIAAVATLAAYFTRSAGAPLLLAVILWLMYRRQYRAIAIVVGIAAPLIFAWWLRSHGQAAGQGGGYLAPFLAVDPYNPKMGTVTPRLMLERFAENLTLYASKHLPRLMFGTMRTGVIFGTAFGIAMMYGWVRRVRKQPTLPEFWLPIYLVLVTLWPAAWAGPRFLFPVVPLLALYVGIAFADLARAASHPRIFALALLAAAVITVQPALRQQMKTGSACRERYANGEDFPCTSPVFEDFFVTAERVRGLLPPGSVVISRKPTIFYAHSGYQSVLYPLSAVPDSLFNLARRVRADYVVVDQIADLAPKYLHPVLLARRDDFCIIPEYSTENAGFAKIEVGGPRRPEAAPNSFRACPVSSAARR